MRRLIEADVLKKHIEEVIKKQNGKNTDLVPVGELMVFIDREPTAYDPDKVVQQLEEKTELAFQRYMNCPKNSPCYQRYQEQYLQRKMCLEIVKAGGADAKTDS